MRVLNIVGEQIKTSKILTFCHFPFSDNFIPVQDLLHSLSWLDHIFQSKAKLVLELECWPTFLYPQHFKLFWRKGLQYKENLPPKPLSATWKRFFGCEENPKIPLWPDVEFLGDERGRKGWIALTNHLAVFVALGDL